MSLIRGRGGFPLSPPSETRNTPDQTRVVEVLGSYDDVVTISEVKEFLPVRHNNYDQTISKLIKSVTEQIEGYIRKDVVKKRLESYWEHVPQIARLSKGHHGNILSVKVVDYDGNETILTENTHFKVRGLTYKSLHDINEYGQLYVEYESGVLNTEFKNRVSGAVLQEISLQFKNRQDPDTPAMTSVNSLSLEARHLLSSVIRRDL